MARPFRHHDDDMLSMARRYLVEVLVIKGLDRTQRREYKGRLRGVKREQRIRARQARRTAKHWVGPTILERPKVEVGGRCAFVWTDFWGFEVQCMHHAGHQSRHQHGRSWVAVGCENLT